MNRTIIALIVILGIIVLCGVMLFLTYPDNVRNRKLNRHEFLTPAVLVGHQEWEALIADWRDLKKLDSWTPEYSKAKEAYRLNFRAFLRQGIDTRPVNEVPIVALTLQNAETLIRQYHTSTHNLDYSKALSEANLIRYVKNEDSTPEPVKTAVELFLDVDNLCQDERVAAALTELEKRKRQFEKMYGHSLPNDDKEKAE